MEWCRQKEGGDQNQKEKRINRIREEPDITVSWGVLKKRKEKGHTSSCKARKGKKKKRNRKELYQRKEEPPTNMQHLS